MQCKACLWLLLLSAILAGCATLGGSRVADARAEAETSFTYGGKPIHPGLVMEFEGWLSDGGPITVAVDVSAADGTDEYFDPAVEVLPSGWVLFHPDEQENQTYAYQWLGKLNNGVHVLRTEDWGGGTGKFINLLFVKFGHDMAYNRDGILYARLLMTVVRSYHLGDRCYAPVKLDGNNVVIGPYGEQKESTILTWGERTPGR